jgi:hypothetical protein
MEHIRFGNFEVYGDPINWSAPGKKEEYHSKDYEDLKYLLEESYIQRFIDEKIGEGWRPPYFMEMKYIHNMKEELKIVNSSKFYLPSSNFIVKETLEDTGKFRIFFEGTDGFENGQPWIPGFLISSTGKRNFKILAVRDV